MILLFGIHCHQPVGNFDFVFEDVYQKSYRPFLEMVYEFPLFKFSLHFSGVLWEWMERKHPESISIIKEMVNRGQVEILSGAFYEAILSVIPSADRVGQISMLNRFIEDRFGVKPAGVWLAERVWSPEIVRDIVDAGISYTLVDDFHFAPIISSEERLMGYYLTEYDGRRLAIFPISKELRYYIPFKPVENVFSYLRRKGNDILTIFDDGEKFGSWPNTYDWVYKDRWLENFLMGFKDISDVSTMHFSEILKKGPPTGRCYLPVSSYFEMCKWSLPAKVQPNFEKAERLLKSANIEYSPFLRGGIWQNFLIKYPESNWMHKRVCWLSKKASISEKAKIHIYKAECNDAYWHGIFGGVYLPHLRHAVYKNIIDAENLLGKDNELYIYDVDFDGFDEIRMSNESLIVYVKPFEDGAVVELDDREGLFNYIDTLARRFESYHLAGDEDSTVDSEDGIPSIHNLKKRRVEERFYYDDTPRYAFREYVFDSMPSAKGLSTGYYSRRECLGTGVYVHRDSPIIWKYLDTGVILKKRYRIKDKTLMADYTLRNISPEKKEFLLGIEINLSLPEVEGVKLVSGKGVYSLKDFVEVDNVGLMEFIGSSFNISLQANRTGRICYYPVYTFFQTEYGFDKILQCSSVCFILLLSMDSGKTERINVRFSIQ